MKLGDLGEFGLIKRIRRAVTDADGIIRGIGDDAAELVLPSGHHLLTTTDLLIEGVHFRLDWTDAKDLGHKAVAVNLSDVAAMGGNPRFLYLGLACPPQTEVATFDRFLNGVIDEVGKHHVVLAGGDTCGSPGPWVISITVEGHAPSGVALGRDGAQPGDVIMVSGTLGDSALALHLRLQGQPTHPWLWNRHQKPQARVALGQALGASRLVNAMIDVSDGLLADLGHILQASGVGAQIESERLPLSPAFLNYAQGDPGLFELALSGGEDYELLFTLPAESVRKMAALSKRLAIPLTPIGRVTSEAGVLSTKASDGTVQPLPIKGYDHFGFSGPLAKNG